MSKNDASPVHTRRAVEGWLSEMFGGSRLKPVEKAQDVMYAAWESRSAKRRIKLARRALDISPDCADAYVLLAGEATPSLEEATELYQKGVKAGERAIGRKAFQENIGHFWLVFETRPYMRAREGLAQCLWEVGRKEESLEHYREMLRLNPHDNQGIRHVLATSLLELGLDEELAKLLKRYEKDAFAVWAYTRVLLGFRCEGDTEHTRNLLEQAKKVNRYVPAFLLGKKKLPKALPDYIGFGDENEAIDYTADNLVLWSKTPGALEWLAACELHSAPILRSSTTASRSAWAASTMARSSAPATTTPTPSPPPSAKRSLPTPSCASPPSKTSSA